MTMKLILDLLETPCITVALVCSVICAPLNETLGEVQTLQTGGTTLPKPEESNTTEQQFHDSDFHADRLALLATEEFNNLGEDANPLHFLKQDKELAKPQPTSATMDTVSNNKPEFSAGTPIYITIPIYINTGGKIPISLTIGEQELPLHKSHKTRNHQTKSPNSYFNRLLQPIESSKRRPTNRHRSQSRSRIQALQEQEKQSKTV